MRGAKRRVARALRARFGIWVLYELRNKILGWPRAVAWRYREDREVRRLRRTIAVPGATVTTVVPTFRRPESLLRAVHSALAQEGVDSHTVLVVDDGGGLPTLPDDPRLVAVSLGRNTAVLGLVRNVGIRLADSPVIAFLDDDNEWYPGHLSSALTALTPDVGGVYTAVERILPDGSRLDVLSQEFDRRTFADESYVDSNSIVVRKRPGLRFSTLPRSRATLPKEDWEFVWRLSRRHRVLHVPEVTVHYTVNPDSYYTTWVDERDDPGTLR